MSSNNSRHLVYVITEDWFFDSHFRDRAIAAKESGYAVSVVTKCRHKANELKTHGLVFENFEFTRRGLNPIKELITIFRLQKLLRKIKPDIVHNIAIKPVVLGSMAAKLAGIHNIVNAPVGMGYVFTSSENKARVLRPLVKRLISFVLNQPNSKVIIENHDDYKSLVDGRFVKKDSIVLIKGAGVDTERFNFTTEPQPPIKVVMISRLLRDKGVYEFIDAAKLVRQVDPSVEFLLVGDTDDGNPTSLSAKEVSDLRHSDDVRWLGARTDIAELLASSHIACLPSYREGLPKSLIEAAAAGRPIVTTDEPGCREVVTHQVNGLLVPSRDSRALAAALLKMVNDKDLRIQTGKTNRNKAEREFSNEIIIHQTQNVYDSFYKS